MADSNSTCKMFSFVTWSIHIDFWVFYCAKRRKERRFEDILELCTHTRQDHRSKRFSVWFTVSQPLQTLFIKKNPNLQQTNFVCVCDRSYFDGTKHTHTQPRNYDIMIWNCCRWKRCREVSGAPAEKQHRATIVLLSTEAAKKKSDRSDAGQFLPGLPRLNSAMWRKQPRPGEPQSQGRVAGSRCPQRPLAKLTSLPGRVTSTTSEIHFSSVTSKMSQRAEKTEAEARYEPQIVERIRRVSSSSTQS